VVILPFWTFLLGAGGTHAHSILFNVDGTGSTTRVHARCQCPAVHVIFVINAGVDRAAEWACRLVKFKSSPFNSLMTYPPLALALVGSRVVK